MENRWAPGTVFKYWAHDPARRACGPLRAWPRLQRGRSVCCTPTHVRPESDMCLRSLRTRAACAALLYDMTAQTSCPTSLCGLAQLLFCHPAVTKHAVHCHCNCSSDVQRTISLVRTNLEACLRSVVEFAISRLPSCRPPIFKDKAVPSCARRILPRARFLCLDLDFRTDFRRLQKKESLCQGPQPLQRCAVPRMILCGDL